MSDAEVRAQAFEDASEDLYEVVRVSARRMLAKFSAGHADPFPRDETAANAALSSAAERLRIRAKQERRGGGPGETIPVAYDENIGWHRVPERGEG